MTLIVPSLILLATLAVGWQGAPTPPRTPFAEEAAGRGITYQPTMYAGFGSGLAFADLDNDGDPDLVTVGAESNPVAIFENLGDGSFRERIGWLATPAPDAAAGVTAADYDGDGDLDLHLSCWLRPNALLRNDGDLTFSDVTTAAGLADNGAGQGCAWGDFNGDSRLDLYLANRTGTTIDIGHDSPDRNALYRNNGDRTFTDVAPSLGVDAADDPSFQAVFIDIDNDADPDLYLANDKGHSRSCSVRNRLWLNEGGQFLDISARSQTDGCIDAMWAAVGDLDGNGFLDLYCTNLPVGNHLYLNNGNQTFGETAGPFGMQSNRTGWGSTFIDVDNDGRLDLYVCNHLAPNRLYWNSDRNACVDIAPSLGVANPRQSFCVAHADIDLDGDLDLAITNRGALQGLPGSVRLYVNPGVESRRWARFRVVGTGANTWGVGCRVKVRTGSHTQIRDVQAGGGFKTQDDLIEHVGLGDADVIDELTVTFAPGITRILTGYGTNRTWTLLPPSKLGDADLDGIIDELDLLAAIDCVLSPDFGPGCEHADFNGDGSVSILDLLRVLEQFLDG